MDLALFEFSAKISESALICVTSADALIGESVANLHHMERKLYLPFSCDAPETNTSFVAFLARAEFTVVPTPPESENDCEIQERMRTSVHWSFARRGDCYRNDSNNPSVSSGMQADINI